MESNLQAKNDTQTPLQPKPSDSHRPRRRRCILCCCATTAIIIIALVITAVILSQTVFKPKRPITTVNGVSLEDFDVSIIGDFDINVTLGVDLSITNPNKVGFQYKNSTAVLRYRGDQVGEAAIPGGEISAGETEEVNVTLTVMADKLLSKSEVYADVIAGDLPLSSYTRITGKVAILGVFKVRVVSISSCDFNIDISSRNITDQKCTYKTKL